MKTADESPMKAFLAAYNSVMYEGDPVSKKEIKEEIARNPKFENFLKKHNAYGKFIKEARKQMTKEDLSDLADTWNPINYALCWHDTKEGDEFWNELDDLWDEEE